MNYGRLDDLTGKLTGLLLVIRKLARDDRVTSFPLPVLHSSDLPVYTSAVVQGALEYFFPPAVCDRLYDELVHKTANPPHFLHVDVMEFFAEHALDVLDYRDAELREIERQRALPTTNVQPTYVH